MMRFIGATFALLSLVAAPAAAQSVYVGLGPTFPSSDYGDYANTGFLIAGGGLYEVAPQISAYGEVYWGQNGHEGGESQTNPYGIIVGGLYDFVADENADFSPYAFAGAGTMTHRYSSDTFDITESDTAFGFQVGAGVGFQVAGINAFGEGRYMSASFDSESPGVGSLATAFFALVIGATFNLGSN